MTIDQSTLTKGQIPKLNALRKSVGNDIAEDAFGKWMKTQSKTPKETRDPVADTLVAALSNLQNDKIFRLGTKGYVVKRSKGKVCGRYRGGIGKVCKPPNSIFEARYGQSDRDVDSYPTVGS